LSEQVRNRLRRVDQLWNATSKEFEACGQPDKNNPDAIAVVRRCQANAVYRGEIYRNLRKNYQVSISTQTIAGVPIEVFTPEEGIAPENRQRILINLHSGAFEAGSRITSQLESIPIAAVAKIKVISVDYRMAPQYSFPAATEDVAAVYAELIKKYDARNVGIYGCSAGGLLTAQSIAWFLDKGLPLPGAIGMFCSGASYWFEGDSGKFAALWEDHQDNFDTKVPYLQNVDSNDSTAYPVRSVELMSRFPPTLLITATRDQTMSSVVYAHSVLVQQGVPAELHIWEGLQHAFFLADPELPQSREVYAVTARFFGRYLGRFGAGSSKLSPDPAAPASEMAAEQTH
jgi:acetyl esterase/lipase